LTPQDWIRLLEFHGTAVVADAGAVPDLPPDATLFQGLRGEQLLWRACAGEPFEPGEAIVVRRGKDMQGNPSPTDGPLLAQDAFLAIEVWSECELAAVHALARLVRLRRGREPDVLAERLRGAVRWHLEHTQPDNATNRPWALHVFLLADDGTGDASLYAETLLHNTLATDARSEPLSRWILADAARELRLAQPHLREAQDMRQV
jgi:hypothetical protein